MSLHVPQPMSMPTAMRQSLMCVKVRNGLRTFRAIGNSAGALLPMTHPQALRLLTTTIALGALCRCRGTGNSMASASLSTPMLFILSPQILPTSPTTTTPQAATAPHSSCQRRWKAAACISTSSRVLPECMCGLTALKWATDRCRKVLLNGTSQNT